MPATQIADQVGNTKVANVVMLGASLALTNLLPDEAILSAIADKATSRKDIAELNAQALRAGRNFVGQEYGRKPFMKN